MDNCDSFVRKIRAKHHITSDYGVAKKLRLEPQSFYSWKKRGSVFSDETGQAIAEALGYDSEYVLLCLNAERCDRDGDPESKKTYERILRLFSQAAKTAAAILLVVLPYSVIFNAFSVYYVKLSESVYWHRNCYSIP